jgi:predicted nucleic acid-binding protein
VILYIDTSALVKLYAKEAGTTEVQRAVAKAEQIATSLIAYVETRSALARKYRLEQVDGAARRHKRSSSAIGPNSTACLWM